MREHGGYSYHPTLETPEEGRVRCALALARAERELQARSDVFVVWEDDCDGTADGERPAWGCVLYRWRDEEVTSPAVLTSLWGIDAPEGDPYRRVVEAELALEADICHPMDRDISRARR
ncbi:MAG: hypothetical protein V7607_1200 [Solirubrobacteraceae bacterium]